MGRNRDIASAEVHIDAPDWRPLIDALVGWFMWMHEVELADGRRLQAYKHVTTREYLHLTADGRAFEYRSGSRYREIDLEDAIVRVFERWRPIPG